VFSGVFWTLAGKCDGQNQNLHPQDYTQGEVTPAGHDSSEELKRTPEEPVTYLSHRCSAKLPTKISKTSSLPLE